MGSHVACRGIGTCDREALPGWCGGGGLGGPCAADPGRARSSVGLRGVFELLPAGSSSWQGAERHGWGACLG